MMPHVPLSRRWRGTPHVDHVARDVERVGAFVDEVDVSGSRRTRRARPRSALELHAATGSASSRSLIVATLFALRACSSSRQAEGAVRRRLVDRRAFDEGRGDRFDVTHQRRGDRLVAVELGGVDVDLDEPRVGDQSGASPWLSSQLRRAPISSTTSARDSASERRGRHGLWVVVGEQALGHPHREVRQARGFDERADLDVRLRVRGALAEHDERPRGVGEQRQRPIHGLRRRQLARRGLGDAPVRLGRGLDVHRLREYRRGMSRYTPPGRPEVAARIARATPRPMSSTRPIRYAALANGSAAANWSSSS